jgi:hypothetical protein
VVSELAGPLNFFVLPAACVFFGVVVPTACLTGLVHLELAIPVCISNLEDTCPLLVGQLLEYGHLSWLHTRTLCSLSLLPMSSFHRVGPNQSRACIPSPCSQPLEAAIMVVWLTSIHAFVWLSSEHESTRAQADIHACAWYQVIVKLLAWCGPCSETLFASAISMQDCAGVSHCAPPPPHHA